MAWPRCSTTPRSGLGVTHPYLDRAVVEFIAWIPVRNRPFAGRSKTLVRSGFQDSLPASVLNRRYKTVANNYFDHVFAAQAGQYHDRYPAVGGVAGAFVDASHYTSLLDLLEAGTVDRNTRDSLWAAWTTMMWLDGLSLYESAPYGIS